jgi:hypothetical protein
VADLHAVVFAHHCNISHYKQYNHPNVNTTISFIYIYPTRLDRLPGHHKEYHYIHSALHTSMYRLLVIVTWWHREKRPMQLRPFADLMCSHQSSDHSRSIHQSSQLLLQQQRRAEKLGV